jgi:hypothetical protein
VARVLWHGTIAVVFAIVAVAVLAGPEMLLLVGYTIVALYGSRRPAEAVYEGLARRGSSPSTAGLVTAILSLVLFCTGVVVVAAIVRYVTERRVGEPA